MKRQAWILVEEEVPDDWDQRICYEVEVTAKNGETARRLKVVRIMPDSAWDLKKNPHVMTRREQYFYSKGWLTGYDKARYLSTEAVEAFRDLIGRAYTEMNVIRTATENVAKAAQNDPDFQVLRRAP